MLAELAVELSDCAFVSCVPHTRKEYFDALSDPNRDFVRSQCPVWPKYVEEILQPLDRLVRVVGGWGVSVTTNASLEEFGSVLRLRPRVVIIFAHWSETSIEFGNGLRAVQMVVDEVPSDYSGFIDLCVCRPKMLADALRAQRPKCIPKRVQSEAYPAFWLSFYLALFQCLRERSCTYLECFESVARGFLRSH